MSDLSILFRRETIARNRDVNLVVVPEPIIDHAANGLHEGLPPMGSGRVDLFLVVLFGYRHASERLNRHPPYFLIPVEVPVTPLAWWWTLAIPFLGTWAAFMGWWVFAKRLKKILVGGIPIKFVFTINLIAHVSVLQKGEGGYFRTHPPKVVRMRSFGGRRVDRR